MLVRFAWVVPPLKILGDGEFQSRTRGAHRRLCLTHSVSQARIGAEQCLGRLLGHPIGSGRPADLYVKWSYEVRCASTYNLVMRISLLAGLLVALSSCSSSAMRAFPSAKADSFISKTESDLIAEYGVPKETYTTTDGTRFLRFQRQSISWDGWDVVNFEVDPDGIVKSWSRSPWSGDQ